MASKTVAKKAPLTNRKPATKKSDDEVSSGKYFKIPPSLIRVEEGFNNRLDYGSEEFDTLKESIKKNGVQEPIRVIPDPKNKKGYVLREGHRRMRAVELLIKAGCEIKKVPAMVSNDETPEQSLVRMLSANSGKAFTNIEKGLTFQKLIDYGWTVNDISDSVGCTIHKVYYCVTLVSFPKKYHVAMAKNEISDNLITRIYRANKDKPEKAEKEIETAIKRAKKHEERLHKEADKESKKTGQPKEKKVVKITNKHLSAKSSASSPMAKLEEALASADKNPTQFNQSKVLTANIIYQILDNKGSVKELLDSWKK